MKIIKVIDNIKVYGLEESIKGSKYPMSTDIDSLTEEITDTVKKLGKCKMGTGHDQFLTGIIVQFDLTFSIKAWVEAERYHFLDFVSSQSTMHRINKFSLTSQCNEYVDAGLLNIVKSKQLAYAADPTPQKKLELLYNIPAGFTLTARMTTNYRQLKTIYYQRKNHALPEWKEFCKTLETLPYFKEIVLGENDET